MDPNAQPLLEYLDPIPSIFEPFQYENMRITWWKSVIVPCNWKTVLDGFLEAYHVPGDPSAAVPDGQAQHEHPVHEGARGAVLLTDHASTSARRTTPASAPGSTRRLASAGGTRTRSGPRHAITTTSARPSSASVEYYVHELRAQHSAPAIRAAEALKTAEIPEGVAAAPVLRGPHPRVRPRRRASTGGPSPPTSGPPPARRGTCSRTRSCFRPRGTPSATGPGRTGTIPTAASTRRSPSSRSRSPTTTRSGTSSRSTSRTGTRRTGARSCTRTSTTARTSRSACTRRASTVTV